MVLLAALGGGGFLGWQLLADKGGAASPEEAVTELVSAVADQDGVAAIRLIAPGEVEGLDDIYSTVQKRLAKENILSSEGGELVDAVSISVEGLEVDVDNLGENAARVYLSDGEVTVRLDSDKLNDSYAPVAARYPDGKTWTLTAEEAFEEFRVGSEDRPFLTSVKIDGRWYVSAIATAGEYAIEELGLDSADYDQLAAEAPEPTSSEDPENAINALIDAVNDQDPDSVLAALPAEQFVTARPFVDTIRSAVDQYGAEISVQRNGNLDTRFEEDGDAGKLTIRKANFSASAYAEGDGGGGSLDLSGDCFQLDGDRECMNNQFNKLTGVDSFWVMLSKANDGWQVDPVATAVAYGRTVLETVPVSVALQAVGLESFIRPTATLKPGEKTSVASDGLGTAMVSVPAKAGQVVTATFENGNDDHYARVYAPDDLEDASSYGGSLVAAKDGDHRLLIFSDSIREQDIDVRVDVMTPKAVEKVQALKPASGQGAAAFTVKLKGTYAGKEDNARFDLYDSKGQEVYLSESGNLDGTYTLVVYGPVTLAKVQTGFAGGGKTYSGNVGSGVSTTVSVNLLGGTEATLSCSSAGDLRLEIDALSARVDDNLSGTEAMSFFVDSSGSYVLDVYNYSDAASFTCTLS